MTSIEEIACGQPEGEYSKQLDAPYPGDVRRAFVCELVCLVVCCGIDGMSQLTSLGYGISAVRTRISTKSRYVAKGASAGKPGSKDDGPGFGGESGQYGGFISFRSD
jgi:hypothetical protein